MYTEHNEQLLQEIIGNILQKLRKQKRSSYQWEIASKSLFLVNHSIVMEV